MSRNSGENKHTLNALDVLIIIVIIAVIATVAANIVRANPGIISGGDKEVKYVLQVKEIPETLKNNIAVGDKLYDKDSGQLIGEVTDFSTEQAYLTGYANDGTPMYTPIDGKTDMFITVKVKVWVEKDSLKIDSFRIAVGKEISCYSQNLAVSGICISITDIS